MEKNILLILCDQLSASALESYGNPFNDAPNIKSLADNGVVIENAYTTCPLCQPARASLWTSLYPHQTGVLSNLPDQGFKGISNDTVTMGDSFSNHGYECVHFGKRHDYGTLRGFKCYDEVQIHIDRHNEAINYDYETFLDENTTRQIEDYFNQESKDRPFFAVADLQNPHNICGYIGENEDGYMDFGEDTILPELPSNYYRDMSEDRPEFLRYLCCAHRRQSQTVGWGDEDYKHYLYAYHHYIHIVDKQVGRILEALGKTGQRENTMIVFISDHGEGMAAHGLVTKYGSFYEETNRIPIFFTGNSVSVGSRISGIASLIDIFPTLLDYAGIETPPKLEGISLYSQIIGNKSITDRQYAIGQWYDEFDGYRIPGRMYADERYKYTVYNDIKYGQGVIIKQTQEELYDMVCDRIEMNNRAQDKTMVNVLYEYRDNFQNYISASDDDFYDIEPEYDKSYRQHEVGCHLHKGPNATLVYASNLKK